MKSEQSVQYVKGVGPKKNKALNRLGIETLYDLLTHYPRRYEDRTNIKKIADAVAGETETVAGQIQQVSESMPRRGLKILKVSITDGSGMMYLTWFNQPFLKAKMKPGLKIFVTGKVAYAYGGQGCKEMHAINSYEFAGSDAESMKAEFLPVYGATDELSQKFLRDIMQVALTETEPVPDSLPERICQQYQFLSHQEAVEKIHFPETAEDITKARERLAFEELYIIQCGLLLLKKKYREQQEGIQHLPNSSLLKKIYKQIPFALTQDQQNVWQEICRDMEKSLPMRRLVQGDVGSGKTIIAALALAKTIENGFQGILMAPTEILASQHFDSMKKLFEPCGVRVGLLSGKLTAKQRAVARQAAAEGTLDLVIGTHALIQEDVCFARPGLVVTDEQHRFGIRQRAVLEEKGERLPDVLVMTATPIPRTMTLTVYGDLDVSIIRQLPPGRKPVRTFVRKPDKRNAIYQFVYDEIQKGRQAYVVCPLIEVSETIDVQSAQEVYEELQQGVLKNVSCALVHGRLLPKEKELLMDGFYKNKIKVLVATTVIEVGVNVPNASIMVIEGAERFGLAQLHQLRGRIGRGGYQSYCILISKGKTENSRERLKIMERSHSGFELAEEDLRLRGPGQFFGSLQHGLPDLKIADVLGDLDILRKARDAALQTIQCLEELALVQKILQLQYKEHFYKITDT